MKTSATQWQPLERCWARERGVSCTRWLMSHQSSLNGTNGSLGKAASTRLQALCALAGQEDMGAPGFSSRGVSSSQVFIKLMAWAVGVNSEVGVSWFKAQFSSFPVCQEEKRGKSFPLLSSLRIFLRLVRKIEIISLAPSHHFIKIKTLADSPNVIFKILLLVRIHFCPIPSQEHFKLFIFFFHPCSIAIYSPSETLYHFSRIQFKLSLQALKGLLAKEIRSTKTQRAAWIPQLWHLHSSFFVNYHNPRDQ